MTAIASVASPNTPYADRRPKAACPPRPVLTAANAETAPTSDSSRAPPIAIYPNVLVICRD